MFRGRISRSRRLPVGLLAGVAAAGLLAGCGGSSGATAAGSTGSASPGSTAASSPASGPTASPLTKGLLSPSAFGSQATVTTLTLQQFRQALGGRLGAASGVTIDPPQCADALKAAHPDVGDVRDLVAESATTRAGGQGTATVEAIATGDLVDGAVGTLTSALQNCPKVTVSAPQGTATVEFSPIDVSKIAGEAAAAQVTATITPQGRGAVSVPALLGAVRDGDRLLLLFTADMAEGVPAGSAQPAPDTAAFTSLLQKAYITEQHALG